MMVDPPQFASVVNDKDNHTSSGHSTPKKFSTPDHPAVKLLERLRSYSELELDIIPPPYHRHDPHELPAFTSDSLQKPSAPVLYLPPLISSLPASHPPLSITQADESYPFMVTETRLPDIDPVSLSLHKALHFFRPYDTKYAGQEYAAAFNWSELRLPIEEERDWYCVAFRSKRKDGSDGSPLYEADKKAHEEAVQNGGLLMYWYGVPDLDTGLNLATCIWQSRKHAIAANSRPHHIVAMKLAKDSYEIYTLERYILRKVAGQEHLFIEPYAGGDIGW